MTSESILFTPYALGPHDLQSHVVMNPLTRSRADEEAVPTSVMVDYYRQRATAGLIVTEGIAPSANGRGYARIPGLWTAAQVAGWQKVTAAVHGAGGVIFAQIMHCGRVGHAANLPAGGRVLAPSAIALDGEIFTDSEGMKPYPLPQEMTEADIAQAIAHYVKAAQNAMAAGFDGVELHGANGYLIEQFLSPLSNQRQDGWGGSVAKRLRFAIEVAEAVAAAIGSANTGMRISPYGRASGMAPYPELEQTYFELLPALARVGLVYLHVVDHTALGNPPAPEGFRAKLRALWPACYIWGGSLDAARAEALLQEGAADLAGFGRDFISNPDLVRRMREGIALAAPDPATFYTPGAKGYSDYPVAG